MTVGEKFNLEDLMNLHILSQSVYVFFRYHTLVSVYLCVYCDMTSESRNSEVRIDIHC
jgi:hypothetical protein